MVNYQSNSNAPILNYPSPKSSPARGKEILKVKIATLPDVSLRSATLRVRNDGREGPEINSR